MSSDVFGVEPKELYWPSKMRDIGFLVLGYVLGSPFTAETGQKILMQFPLILFMTIVTIGLSLFFGYVTTRYTGLNRETAIFSSIPGGMSQIPAICENIESVNMAVVTLLQTIRVLVVVFFVPFIALHSLAEEVSQISGEVVESVPGDISTFFLFAGAIAAAVFLFKYLGMSNPYVLAPMLATAGMVLAGVNPPPLPYPLIAAAQIFIGLRLGTSIKIENLSNWKTISLFGVLGMMMVIGLSLAMSYFCAQTTSLSMITIFIGVAPGGISEMGVTAMMVHADLSSVVAFQLFRLIFIFLLVIPIAKWWLNKKTVPN